MTCQNCATCACKESKAPFEEVMEQAGRNLQYIADHLEHPQAESLIYPRRVAVGDVFMGVVIRADDPGVDRIFIYADDKPDTNPVMYVNSISMGLWNPDAPPPLAISSQLPELMNQFHNLLHTSFFQG